MRVQLRIEEDAELRAAVKDLIDGQVKSVARQEIRQIVQELVKDSSEKNIVKLLEQSIANYVVDAFGNSYNMRDSIKKMVAEEIKNVVYDAVMRMLAGDEQLQQRLQRMKDMLDDSKLENVSK